MDKITPINEEFLFEGDVNISQTDLNSTITYINRAFCNISGYSKEELIGKEHNIIRHPDMPKNVFVKLWNTISDGQAWNGLVKNLRKDGKFYWVDIEILPIKDDNDTITGFIAVQKKASRKDINETAQTYKNMLQAQE